MNAVSPVPRGRAFLWRLVSRLATVALAVISVCAVLHVAGVLRAPDGAGETAGVLAAVLARLGCSAR